MFSRSSGIKTILLTAVTFGLVGPFFGTLAFAVWGFALGGPPVSLTEGLLAGLWMLPFGYLIGFAPAALTGLAVGFVKGRTGPAVFVAAATVAGFAVTWGLEALMASGPDVDGGRVNLSLIGAAAGALSALVSWAMGGIARERRARS